MTQTVPLVMILGAAHTGETIGYRVLNLDRTEYSAFSTVNVAESAVAGTYYVSTGIAAPDAGGYVVVGTALADYGESTIEAETLQGATLSESYAADGAAATAAQLLYMIWSLLAEKAVSGVTVTAKKLDGAETAMTFTLDDGTDPTSITRAS